MMARAERRSVSPATIAVHGGAERSDLDGGVPPVIRELPVEVEYGGSDGIRRTATTDASDSVAQRVAALEGAEAAQLVGTGLGATAAALLALLRPGDHLLASSWLPGGVRRFLVEELGPMGIDVSLVDPLESRGWRKRVRKQTRAIFVESPVSGSGRVLDLRPISYLTHEVGLALVVDATRATPAVFRPIAHGADVVIHSSLRLLGGAPDVAGGVVAGTASYIEEVREKMFRWGQAPHPDAAWLLLRSLPSLFVRLARQGESAERIARWAAGRKDIRKVHWPGLADHPDQEIASVMLDRPVPFVGIELGGGAKAADRCLRRLRLVRPAAALGAAETCASEPRLVTHPHLDAQERGILGMPDGLIQIALGLEDPDDLIADFEQALR
ncbi:MAG: PLP-dependent transferase [Gemmatimonadaceae bacterium]|nr:PLP-dependent transferase [Gemmatimonadaceae bacterium]